MNFDPKDMDVKTLFKTYPTFNIPIFQRDYSWDKPFYSKFLEDILSGISVNGSELENSIYFIGTMVFSGRQREHKIDVVDGQQRLTVMTILLSVITEKLEKEKEEGLASATFKYVKDVDDNNEPICHLVSATSSPYFDCFIQSRNKENAPNVNTEEEENIKLTYDYFSYVLSEEKIKKDFPKLKLIEYVKILVGIRDQMLSSMLIAIVTPDKDSAYMIFEILNAKGKNLASIDLIKNVIFEKLHGDQNGSVALAEKMWEDTKNQLRNRDNSIGLATFYRHYWISKYAKVTNVKLYDSFKASISPKNVKTYMEFISDLNSAAKKYVQILSPRLEDYQNRKEYKWLVQSLNSFQNSFGIVQTRIALLALFDIKESNKISTASFKDAVQFIENFTFSYTAIAKKPANIYESRFSKLAIELRKTSSKDQTNKILREFLYDVFEDKLPKYEEFEENFILLTFTKERVSSNNLTKYVLNKISQNISKRDFFWDDSSIEHIINEDANIPETLSIGNLICLEEVLNNEADNLNYTEKTEIYSNSKYKQVKDFIQKYPQFDIDKSKERSKLLAQFYYKEILKKNI
ncbi:DUF262 domain-containing protein [Enterococcus sp. AZ062]|uniref:DUF262 domain-containing protein n=1 Tax=Enterococcus sp. AZ062 TaxID=2774692 RepID=UPI003F1E6A8B